MRLPVLTISEVGAGCGFLWLTPSSKSDARMKGSFRETKRVETSALSFILCVAEFREFVRNVI